MFNPFKRNDPHSMEAMRGMMKDRDITPPQPPAAPVLDLQVQDMVRLSKVFDHAAQHYANRQSSMGQGNYRSGFAQFLPAFLNDRKTIENLCISSWVADRFIAMPVNDMFTAARTYSDETFEAESDRLGADPKLAAAMRTGRKYGSGIIWAVVKGQNPEIPLNIDRVRPGDLANLLVFDKDSSTILSKNQDILSENFGQPEYYQLNIHQVGQFTVHASHVHRFDGLAADTVNGWLGFQPDWGVSNLSQAVGDIMNDQQTVQAINHLVKEASIPVQKVQGLKDMLCSTPIADEMSIEDRMSAVNKLKDVYSTMLMDVNDNFERVNVTFAGLPDLLEKSSDRLAMMAGISATRFLNKAPDGENATGIGDMLNDNRTTRTRQDHLLKPAYTWLDPIIAASAGTQVPDYEFPPLFELTQEQLAKVGKTRAETSAIMTGASIWTEDEGKEYVATGNLPEGPVEVDIEAEKELQKTIAAMNAPVPPVEEPEE